LDFWGDRGTEVGQGIEIRKVKKVEESTKQNKKGGKRESKIRGTILKNTMPPCKAQERQQESRREQKSKNHLLRKGGTTREKNPKRAERTGQNFKQEMQIRMFLKKKKA